MNIKNYLSRISTFKNQVKKDNELMEAVERIYNNNEEDWKKIQSFAIEIQDALAENALFEEDNESRKASKHYIRGMLDIVLLPEIRKQVVKEVDRARITQAKEKEAAERRKFNPGAWLNKLKGE